MPERRSTIEMHAAQLCKLARDGKLDELHAAARRHLTNAYRRGVRRGYVDGWAQAKKHWRPHKRQAAEMEARQEAQP